jgi:site-specific DNA recombinase
VVVVYKVDRLTCSLADFAKLVELFDGHRVSFVSVTQHFNTTSSMGRLTLNVLLSFAQFEREVSGERIRDKIAASRKKGMRMGGPVALGYRVADKKLVVDEAEAETVRLIFTRYLALGCLTTLAAELRERKIVTKVSRRRDGGSRGGVPFTKSALSYLLRNRRGDPQGAALSGPADADRAARAVRRRPEHSRRQGARHRQPLGQPRRAALGPALRSA